ncbi:MAG: FkbM family methyltransferase [Saprospiraceae bacterium]|nr:FkbM family methyltransferase [Saprospiraceae bacterium]
MNWKTKLGILKSRLIYDWKPGNKRSMLKFYSQFIQPGDLCFDLGAHLGNRTENWRSIKAHVVAVEPNPTFFKILQSKFGSDPKVILYPSAVGASRGSGLLHINSISPTISTLRDTSWREMMSGLSPFALNWDKQITVEIQTLEDLIKRHGVPTYCKIDVEGLELQVLNGLQTAIPHLSFEFINPGLEDVSECLTRINQLGNYSFNYSLREQHNFQLPKYVDSKMLIKSLCNLGQKVISGDIYAKQGGDENN